MLSIFKTIDNELASMDELCEGCWINLSAPTQSELEWVANMTGADPDYLRAALDEEERARTESREGQTLIMCDIPRVESEDGTYVYTTLPLGIVLLDDCIITICLLESSLISDFINNRIKGLYTHKRSRFIFQLLYRNATRFLMYLRRIDKASNQIHSEMQKSYRNKELFQMMALEKSLVYFSTSLKSNEMVLEKLVKVNYIRTYPEDEELLDDVIIENKQAIEMCSIYRDILSGTMDAYASIISNNLNIVMKFLAAVTIVISLPTLIFSAWGMNVKVPWEGQAAGFWIVSGIAVAIAIISVIWLDKRKMF